MTTTIEKLETLIKDARSNGNTGWVNILTDLITSHQSEGATILRQLENLTDCVNKSIDELGKLRRFKSYVHKRLDAHGVPTMADDPEATTTGCRVGRRLDWSIGRNRHAYAVIMARKPDDIAPTKPGHDLDPAWRQAIHTLQDLDKTPADLQTWADQHCSSCGELITDNRQTEDGECLPCVGRTAIPCSTCQGTGKIDGIPCVPCEGFGERWEAKTKA